MPSEKYMKSVYGASGFVDTSKASTERPIYRKVEESPERPTKTFMIICDEGWREQIVCSGMYEWAADWLIEEIQYKPYASRVGGEVAECERQSARALRVGACDC